MKRPPLSHVSIWIFYYKYRDTLVFSIAVLGLVSIVSLFLFWKVIIPQIQKWFSIQEEVARAQTRIKNIQDNIRFVLQIDNNELTNNLQTTTFAYPSDKDFIGILSVVSNAAISANVSLNEFSFSVGELSPNAENFKVIPIQMKISMKATTQGLTNFIQFMEQALPLSQVESISSNAEASTVTFLFPFKPFPKISYSDSEVIKPLSNEESTLLDTLSQWKSTSPSSESIQ